MLAKIVPSITLLKQVSSGLLKNVKLHIMHIQFIYIYIYIYIYNRIWHEITHKRFICQQTKPNQLRIALQNLVSLSDQKTSDQTSGLWGLGVPDKVTKTLDCNIVVCGFELQLHYHVYLDWLHWKENDATYRPIYVLIGLYI